MMQRENQLDFGERLWREESSFDSKVVWMGVPLTAAKQGERGEGV